MGADQKLDINQKIKTSTQVLDANSKQVLIANLDNIVDYTQGVFKYLGKDSKLEAVFMDSIITASKTIWGITSQYIDAFKQSDINNYTQIVLNLTKDIGDSYLNKSEMVPLVKLLCSNEDSGIETIHNLQSIFDEVVKNIDTDNSLNKFGSAVCDISNTIENEYDGNVCALGKINEISNDARLLNNKQLFNTYVNKIDKCLGNDLLANKLDFYYLILDVNSNVKINDSLAIANNVSNITTQENLNITKGNLSGISNEENIDLL